MGYALAEAARDRGAHVTLVSTIDSLPVPYGVEHVLVETVAEMREAVLAACETAEALVMAAAMSDFRSAHPAEQKIKKGEGGELTLDLIPNLSFFPEVPDARGKGGVRRGIGECDRKRSAQAAVSRAPRSDLCERRLGGGCRASAWTPTSLRCCSRDAMQRSCH